MLDSLFPHTTYATTMMTVVTPVVPASTKYTRPEYDTKVASNVHMETKFVRRDISVLKEATNERIAPTLSLDT